MPLAWLAFYGKDLVGCSVWAYASGFPSFIAPFGDIRTVNLKLASAFEIEQAWLTDSDVIRTPAFTPFVCRQSVSTS